MQTTPSTSGTVSLDDIAWWYAQYERHLTTSECLAGMAQAEAAAEHRQISEHAMDLYFELIERYVGRE